MKTRLCMSICPKRIVLQALEGSLRVFQEHAMAGSGDGDVLALGEELGAGFDVGGVDEAVLEAGVEVDGGFNPGEEGF